MRSQPTIYRIYNNTTLNALMKKLNVDDVGISIMLKKGNHILIFIKNLNVKAANILKQEFLASGGDLAISKEASMFRVKYTDAVGMATLGQYQHIISKLGIQPFGLKEIGTKIRNVLERENRSISIDLLPDLYKKTYVMGILNVTPDSFYDGNRYLEKENALKHGRMMITEHADIIDVGGESSRPGSSEVPLKTELERVIPVIRELSREHATISVDTRHYQVAEEAMKAGASIINDITGFRSQKMIEVAKKWNATVVVMHMKGTPANMHVNPAYNDLITDIYNFFEKQTEKLEKEGVSKIIIDPGIGFGKRYEHNIEILEHLGSFRSLGYPILVGVSRKSFIGWITGKAVDDRLYGTLAAEAIALKNGADILRVHDVPETVDFVKVWDRIDRSI